MPPILGITINNQRSHSEKSKRTEESLSLNRFLDVAQNDISS